MSLFLLLGTRYTTTSRTDVYLRQTNSLSYQCAILEELRQHAVVVSVQRKMPHLHRTNDSYPATESLFMMPLLVPSLSASLESTPPSLAVIFSREGDGPGPPRSTKSISTESTPGLYVGLLEDQTMGLRGDEVWGKEAPRRLIREHHGGHNGI